MCQTTHLKILGMVTFSDLTLNLTWAKYETISLVSTFAWSLGVHMESFGRKMLRLRSLRSATWKHPILTFDLTLTWHVTSILNFRKWFGSVSSRSFECRLVRLSTSIRFRDSTGGGSDPIPSPRLWWVQKQPRRWRVNWTDGAADGTDQRQGRLDWSSTDVGDRTDGTDVRYCGLYR